MPIGTPLFPPAIPLQTGGGVDSGMAVILVTVAVLMVFLSVFLYIARYRTAPPSRALVLQGGGRRELTVIIGGGRFLPFGSRVVQELPLRAVAVDVQVRAARTTSVAPDGRPVEIDVDLTAIVAIDPDVPGVMRAAERLRASKAEEVADAARLVLARAMTAVCARSAFEETLAARARYSEACQEAAVEELSRLGISILHIALGRVDDSGTYLEELISQHLRTDAAVMRTLVGRTGRVVSPIGPAQEGRIAVDLPKVGLQNYPARGAVEMPEGTVVRLAGRTANGFHVVIALDR